MSREPGVPHSLLRHVNCGRHHSSRQSEALMDLNLTQDERQFRDELRTWLAANAPKDWSEHRDESLSARFDFLRRWQRKLYDAGWAGVSWPKEYGGRGASL